MPNSWWKCTRDEAERVEIDIYGDIGESIWGDETSTSAKEFLDMVRAADGKDIELHVNSGGGSVFDAFAMMTALANHGGRVTAYVDGIAASAASFLLAAADEVVVSSAAFLMIHAASTSCWGNASEMRETAAWLDTVDGQLAGIYAKRGNRSQDEFKAAMDATTWFTADEAVAWGLADRVCEAVAAAACVTADRRALETAPSGANIIDHLAHPAPVDSNGAEGDGEAQEGEPAAQERDVLVGFNVYRIKTER